MDSFKTILFKKESKMTLSRIRTYQKVFVLFLNGIKLFLENKNI